MQSPKDITDSYRQETSCEIFQEIYGLGAYYLMRADEEALFNRLFAKYQNRKNRPAQVKGDESDFELSLRKAISRRKAEFATGGFYTAPPPKESIVSSHTLKGTVDKDVVDAQRVIRRMNLG
jgi:hypothetical protein